MRYLVVALALLLCAAPLAAQTLTVNGQVGAVLVELGNVVTTELTGPPNQLHFWFFNTNPGPRVINGVTIPVSLANVIDFGMGQPMPPSGVRTLSAPLGLNPGLSGVTFYGAGVFYAPSTPAGFEVTNGVAATLVLPGGNAGPDAAGFINEPIVMDGSGNRTANGQLPAGTTLQWIVVDAPNGSSPILVNDTTEFPALVTDTVGTYELELQIQNSSGFFADRATIDVFSLDLDQSQGAFIPGSSPISGSVSGPAPLLTIDGIATPLSSGLFNGTPASFTDVLGAVEFVVTGQNGAPARRRLTLVNGVGTPLGTATRLGAVSRLQNVDLSILEAPLELVIAQLPLNTLITAIPPLPLSTSALFSATIAFTQATYDQANVDVAFTPGAQGNFNLAITIPNLVINADLTGTLFFVPYAETATISADAVVISADIGITANPSTCALEVTTSNEMTTFQNFNFAVTGVLNGLAQLGPLQTGIQSALGLAFNGFLALIPPALNGALGALTIPPIDLSASGIPLVVEFPIDSITYDAFGLSLATKFEATPLTTSQTAAPITESFATTAIPVTFTGTTPVNGAPFDLAFGVNDDTWNQTLAALTGAGAFDLTLGSGSLVNLDAGQAAAALPGAGFDLFNPATPIALRVSPRVAPVVSFSSAGSAGVMLDLGALLLEFVVIDGSAEIAILRLDVAVNAPLNVGVDPVGGTLTVSPGLPTIDALVVSSLAGQDPSSALSAGLQPLIQAVLSLVTAPLSALPLPGAAGGGLLIPEISISGDAIVVYIDLP